MALLLDTNHASAILLRDRRLELLGKRIQDEELLLPLPALGELWFMVHNSARATENANKLRRLLQQIILVPFDETAAEEFGQIRAELRRKGKPIPQIDAQIAAIARVLRMTLLTADAHFTFVDRLEIDNWLR